MFCNPGPKSLTLVFLLLSLNSVSSLTKKFYYAPGIDDQQITFRSDYANTKVLHNFRDEVGHDRANVIALEDAGFYSLKVINVNGSFVDDVWLYHAIPSWLCKFTIEDYLLEPIPTEFVYNRTAVVACTILGSPQPTFVWEKYNSETQRWNSLSDLGLLDSSRYIQSHVLGHLYIKYFNKKDTGRYRCRASNECGGRCPNEPRCSEEDVIGDPIYLQLRVPVKTESPSHYFLNPIINQCWDTEGNYFTDGAASRFCSGLKTKASHIYSFSQYTSINSTATMEAFFDYERMQNDDGDYFRIGSVRWNEYDIGNFHVLEDYEATSGICIAEIEGFKSSNMKEYYYCNAYFPNDLLMQGLRFEFVMKEAPFIGLPRGVLAKKMSRVIVASYGSKQSFRFELTPNFSSEEIQGNTIKVLMCLFNTKNISHAWDMPDGHGGWHIACAYNASNNDIVTFSIDYVVFGDAGYYQIVAGNDEGWAIGPPILLVVTGTEPNQGPYVLTELARTTNKITVRWNRPNSGFNRDPVYEVWCQNKDWDEDPIRLLVAGVEWTELTNLRPGVQYAITVWLNDGLVADTKEIRTLPIRTEAIVSFTCTSGATYIKCRWDKPDPSTFHSQNLHYEVEIKDPKRKDRNTTIVQDKLDTIMSNLRPFTDYKIKIIACNIKGCAKAQNATSFKQFKTEEELPGRVVFAKEPRPKPFSVFVVMKYPSILPGVLETEVVRYEEEHYKKIRDELKAKENKRGKNDIIVQNILLVGNETASSNDSTVPLRYYNNIEIENESYLSTEAPGYYISSTEMSNENRLWSGHLFDDEEFEIVGLDPSTTYWMKFRWKTGAGPGPFTPYMKIRIGRYINYKQIVIGCSIAAFFAILAAGFIFYVNRRWPGLAKVVFQKIRDYINPSYMAPIDPLDAFHMQTEDDPNIVYEFDMTQNDI
ncbi:uncharacterized protein LOC134825002 isoform X2 [Bolinopsis microptera]|uniref:uncharacterized protein LOC134825002 isoform X2 n=1 Tax=Bolinopsis microptera TaxID=2820187 RepID=UPI00307903F6